MLKILAIDDNILFLETIVIYLEVKEWQVITAQNGRLGLQLVETHKPDLIICDIQMPGLDGYDVLRILRQNPKTKKIPLIFVTGAVTERDRHFALELGANDYLDKICIFDHLIKAIETQLESTTQPILFT